MKRALTILAVLVAAVAVSPAAANIAETIKLAPKGGSGVSGTATVSSPGDDAAAAVRVSLRGLKPGAVVRIQLNVIEAGRVSASTVRILTAKAGKKGTLSAAGRVRYRGEPVTFASIADGTHAISVVTGGKVVARGIVPGMD